MQPNRPAPGRGRHPATGCRQGSEALPRALAGTVSLTAIPPRWGDWHATPAPRGERPAVKVEITVKLKRAKLRADWLGLEPLPNTRPDWCWSDGSESPELAELLRPVDPF
jgi:hypothetical protein